eukprot:TRINITY_DN7918_c0_g2_i3.p2 TRINITY_DN7918_c0_g2~~TRINITY_DN7918_c0_g2_i3.p2  ORF type:complete len:176 (+),score=36.23 TRINITY_DN7918_c0_g2_i3:125-652(+)
MISKLFTLFWSNQEYKIIMVGLNDAGKTTTLYKLLYDEVVDTAPTLGSNVEEFSYRNIKLIMWDIGGQQSLRPSWSHYYNGTSVVIYVVDSTDRERLPECQAILQEMLKHEHLSNVNLLVLANKNDVVDAMDASEVGEKLGLNNLLDTPYHIQSCCALTGEGIFDGMDWVISKLG